jgi:hypothetical protein
MPDDVPVSSTDADGHDDHGHGHHGHGHHGHGHEDEHDDHAHGGPLARLRHLLALHSYDVTDKINSQLETSREVLWQAIRRHGIEGLRARAEAARELAAYTCQRLNEIGWEAWRHEHGFTVVLKTPPTDVIQRWVLASYSGWSHVVCVPGVGREQVDAFIGDLEALRDDVGEITAGMGGVVSQRDRSSPTTPSIAPLFRSRLSCRWEIQS